MCGQFGLCARDGTLYCRRRPAVHLLVRRSGIGGVNVCGKYRVYGMVLSLLTVSLQAGRAGAGRAIVDVAAEVVVVR